MTKALVMYTRTMGCPFVTVAKKVLNEQNVIYREVFIDKDKEAKENVRAWTGFLSVPTLVIAEVGSVLPIEAPTPLAKGESPRGIDRGTMITEPSRDELHTWLTKHQLIKNGQPLS